MMDFIVVSRRRFYILPLLVLAITAMIDDVFQNSLSAAQFPESMGQYIQDVPNRLIPSACPAATVEIIPENSNAKIAPDLQKLIVHGTAALRPGDGRSPQMAFPEKIRVIFHTTDEASLSRKVIENCGGKILRTRAYLVTAEVSPDRLKDICAEKTMSYARLPHRFTPLGVSSEGVSLTGAGSFHTLGYRGAGVKAAVIDIGFKGLSQAIASGDLPQNIVSRDFTANGLETQYKHGTACAEIVHDMAPDAELHLLKIADEEDLYAAYDYCMENHIDILSFSIGTFGSGPGNGTGPFADFCDEARANGMLVIAAAGNGANFYSGDNVPIGTHWKGFFADADQNAIHEFFPGVEGNTILALLDHDDDGNPLYDEVTITMRWNDWPVASTDYDMYLYNFDYQTQTRGTLAAYSTGLQNGSQPPVEMVVLDLPEGTANRFYELVVVRKEGSPAGRELEISTAGGNSYFIGATPYAAPMATSAGSIMEPADAESVLTVGAIGWNQWNDGPQEDYSSQGPTNAWAGSAARIKPDICGPDGVVSNTYGSFFPGTSAAAPHAAGAAALLKSLHPGLSPSEIQRYLESWAQDMGFSGKDNQYGWGRLRMLIHSLYTSKAGSGSGTILGSPAGLIDCGSSCTAAYASGMRVTLTAVPEPGSVFTGWSGACLGSGQCTLDMTESKSVIATFTRNYMLSITKSGSGSGTVASTPEGITCGKDCSASYASGTYVALTATPASGSSFAGWSGGGCTGTDNCSLTVNANAAINALFYNPSGDIDNDNQITLADAILALGVLANINIGESSLTAGADANGDSRIGTAEALYILQRLADLR